MNVDTNVPAAIAVGVALEPLATLCWNCSTVLSLLLLLLLLPIVRLE
jgi:hypothetical protein